jgi:hypothetical protein
VSISGPTTRRDIRRIINTISDRKKNKNPYKRNAIQKPPIIFSASVITEECLDSIILAATNVNASRKNIIEYKTLLSLREAIAL